MLARHARSFAARGFASSAGNDAVHGGATPITLQLWSQRLRRDRETQASSQAAEPTIKVTSRTTVTYPFVTDHVLQEKYRNPWGAVRIGKLLEDLDALAGSVAYNHCDPGPGFRLPMLVTAAVDAIQINHRLNLDNDLEMSGQVAWTGSSSMDIRMELRQAQHDSPSLVALFTFVARDALTSKSTRVNPLEPQTADDKALFAERQKVADDRRAQRAAPSSSSSPAGAQHPSHAWAQGLLAEARAMADLPALAAGDCVLMRDTAAANVFVCQPQQRNLHGRVFGGFLMRRAYELAFATAYMFSGTRPKFVMVDEVTFQRPVDVGDLLRLRSSVLHTARLPSMLAGAPAQQEDVGRVHVQVSALVVQPEHIASNVTNTFEFVFEVKLANAPGEAGCKLLKRVLPSTEEEAKQLWVHFPGIS